MKGNGFFVKRRQRQLLVPVFFLTLLTAGCQSASYVESDPAETDIPENTITETSKHYHSDTSKEDCLICGEARGTALPLYRGQENLGIINLNSFDLAPVTINRYDDSGNPIKKLENSFSTHITNIGENGFFLSVSADTNRGYAHGYLSFDKKEALDMDQAASHLCTDCLNQALDNCWSDDPLSVGVIDFGTGDIRLFEERITAFTFGDYYVSCDNRDMDDEDTREIDLLIFYCPERYQD